eukprot:832705-Prymnesium_polylepis.1
MSSPSDAFNDDDYFFDFFRKLLDRKTHEWLGVALRRVAIFKTVDEERLAKITYVMRPFNVEAGDFVCKQGDERDAEFHILGDGTAEVVRSEGDETKVLKILRRGDYFGVRALLKNEVNYASVQAQTRIKVYALIKKGVEAVLASGSRRPCKDPNGLLRGLLTSLGAACHHFQSREAISAGSRRRGLACPHTVGCAAVSLRDLVLAHRAGGRRGAVLSNSCFLGLGDPRRCLSPPTACRAPTCCRGGLAHEPLLTRPRPDRLPRLALVVTAVPPRV